MKSHNEHIHNDPDGIFKDRGTRERERKRETARDRDRDRQEDRQREIKKKN